MTLATIGPKAFSAPRAAAAALGHLTGLDRVDHDVAKPGRHAEAREPLGKVDRQMAVDQRAQHRHADDRAQLAAGRGGAGGHAGVFRRHDGQCD